MPPVLPSALSHAAGEGELMTWTEFVGVFVPLGSMENAKKTATEETEVDSWRAGLNDEELELLTVAFATVDHGCDGRVSLAELRAACAELDEEEPPDALVYSAIGVRSVALEFKAFVLLVTLVRLMLFSGAFRVIVLRLNLFPALVEFREKCTFLFVCSMPFLALLFCYCWMSSIHLFLVSTSVALLFNPQV